MFDQKRFAKRPEYNCARRKSPIVNYAYTIDQEKIVR